MATKKAAAHAIAECDNCGADNPGDYTFCFACRAPAGVTNEMGVNEVGELAATGKVFDDGKPRKEPAPPAIASALGMTKKERRAAAARAKRAAAKRVA